MKRVLFVLSLFLIVFVSDIQNIFASSGGGGYHSVTGYSTWTQEEKREYQKYCLKNNPYIGVYGWECPSDEILATKYPDIYTQGYSSYLDFLIDHSTVDEETETITYDAEGLAFINFIKADAEEQITYQNMYLPSSVQITASTFTTKSAYSKFYFLVKNNPDKVFSICRATHNYNGMSGIAGWTIRVHDADICGVSSLTNSGMGLFDVNVFDSEWQRNFTWVEFYLCDTASNSKLVYKNDADEWVEIDDIEEVKTFDISLATNTYGAGTTTKFGSTSASWNGSVETQNQIFTDFNGVFPVYVSITAMKNGTSSGICGQYMPGYTPGAITDNSITQTEINDYSTNYNNYYGSGSGGGGSGSGSGSGSSGSWLDSLLSGLGNVGNIIMSLLSKAFEIITEILEFFTDTLMNVMDIVPTGFVEFMGMMFSFVPPEWITAISLLLALVLVLVIIKVFKK